ncbi:MAG: M28 family metallopeptidase [Candidatus Heimdallarchaeota archaeon]
MFICKKTWVFTILLATVFMSSNIQPVISPISESYVTTSSYESYFLDQFDGNRAWQIVNSLANASFEGRLTATRGQHRAANFIAEQFEEIGLFPAGDPVKSDEETRSYFQNFALSVQEGKWTNGSTKNVLGWLQGKSDERVIISAHYDHLGNWVNETPPFAREEKGLYAGADDNASGVAVLLELARLLIEYITRYGLPDRSILFACWSGEEEGLYGSRYYYNSTNSTLEETVLNINLDMVGGLRTENFGFEIEGGTDFPELYEKFEMASAISGIPVHNTSMGGRSDHYSAYRAGIPAVLVFWDTISNITRSHPYYHSPQDIPDLTDPANLRDAGVLTGLVLQSYCFVDLLDTTSPVILNVTHFTYNVGEVIFISRVVDNIEVKAVMLHYSTNGGVSWSIKAMTATSSEYMTSIESLEEGYWITFYVSATDMRKNSASTAVAEILVDTHPPTILTVQHTPSQPTEQDEIDVKARVDDNLAITSVILLYSLDGGATWKSVPMLLTEKLYIATIGPFPAETIITYYVLASDIGGNTAGGEIRELQQFKIQEIAVFEFSRSILSISFTFGLLFTLIIRKKKIKKVRKIFRVFR